MELYTAVQHAEAQAAGEPNQMAAPTQVGAKFSKSDGWWKRDFKRPEFDLDVLHTQHKRSEM